MPVEELSGLVTRWRRAGGSMERVRVIASGARTLAGLSPDDRRLLAQALTEVGAPEVADRLAHPGGRALSSSELTDLARALLSVDPQDLDRLARSLRDPDERRRLLVAAAGGLEELLDEEPDPTLAPAGPAVPLPPPRGADAVDREPPDRTRLDVEALDPDALDPDTLELGTIELGTIELGAADLGHVDLGSADLEPAAPVETATAATEPDDARSVEPVEAPLPPDPRSREVRSSARPVAATDAVTRAAPAVRAGPTTSGAAAGTAARAPTPAPTTPPGALEATLTGLRRAGTARGRLAAATALEGVRLTGDDLLAVLDAVPDGWQRRTVARRLLRAGGAPGVDGRAVLTRFARDADRIAVANVLLDVADADVDALADALPARAAARLRRRAGRS